MEKVAHPNDDARGTASKIISFSRWVPYAIAAGLMFLAISQARQILHLKSQLLAAHADAARLRESNALIGLQLILLEPKDATLDASPAASKIVIVWDPYRHRGVVATQSLPAPPVGHDYQLWVLDPDAEAPISAGVIRGPGPFTVKPVNTPTPGFAVSLEPSGGSPLLTGPILFAVAPGP
jgi:anti-sigma-K factor RskA